MSSLTDEHKGQRAFGRVSAAGFAVLLFTFAAGTLDAQSAENVAVVINERSPASQKIADYYVRKRGIPTSNVVRIATTVDETISRADYISTIEQPIAAALTRASLQDRVLYLVLTKGIPLRVDGSGQATGTMSSVDSELTLLYRRLTGINVPIAGRIDNPYFSGSRDPAKAPAFTHKDFDIYLVTRLDAFTVDDVMALIDAGSAPRKDGRIVLDQQDKLTNRQGEDWLEAAAKRLEAQGEAERVVLETTTKGARGISPVLGYYSWGSNDPRNRARKLDMGFVAGSLAATFVSTDARTFREPPQTWTPSEDTNRSTWFQGSPQSLIGDLIREGATGVAGHVAEPFLLSAIRPEILFPGYLAGLNLAEAFYAAMPHLSWQAVVVGDPLCAPFRRTSSAKSEIDGGADPETLLPAFFSARRVARLLAASPAAGARAAALAVRGDVLIMRGERVAARAAYEAATAQAPQLAGAQLQLALILDQQGEIDAAITRYRQVLVHEPRNPRALNNLAYRLAVDRKNPAEAISFARQAVQVAPQDPTILDTLAWVQYLLGDSAAAAKTMAEALKSSPRSGEIRLHAAIIYAATGARAVAQDQLTAAIQLEPSLENSPEVKRLREQLRTAASTP